MGSSPKVWVYVGAFGICLGTVLIAAAIQSGWPVFLSVVLVPLLGWFAKRRGWI